MASTSRKEYNMRGGPTSSNKNQIKKASTPDISDDDHDETEVKNSPYEMSTEYSDATVEYSLPEYEHGDFASSGESDCDQEVLDGQKESKGIGKLRQTTLSFLKKKVDKNSKRDESGKESKKPKLKKMKYSDADTAAYRMGYPNKKDDPTVTDNRDFYFGRIKSHPHGDYIDEIHKNWFGDYDLLEQHHGYIQWIFPIREEGMNWHAQALQLHEAKEIQENLEARERVRRSYEMMLDFYGMELEDQLTGGLKRSPNWKSRFDNLNWSSHNYLRITRILKSLGELGFEHFKRPFLEFLMKEGMKKKTLVSAMRSCRDYWIGTIKNDDDREELQNQMEEWKDPH